MAEALVWVTLVLGAAMVLGAAYLSYRRRRRKGQRMIAREDVQGQIDTAINDLQLLLEKETIDS